MKRAWLVGLFMVVLTCCGRGYSVGERSGTVYKLSYKGLMYKSYEGELLLGTATGGNNGTMTPDVWKFTVVDQNVAHKIQAANEAGRRVTLHYVQWFQSPCSMDTDYEIVDVDVTAQ